MKDTKSIKNHQNLISQCICGSCGSDNIETRKINTTFPFTKGKETVELKVTIPVNKCLDCNFEFTGPDADELRHNAVCEHLNVMTPSQIQKVRNSLSLSTAEFSKRTGIGVASISRWEKGALIQNKAMDNFLFLLSKGKNLELLDAREFHSRDVRREVKFKHLHLTSFSFYASQEFQLH